MATSIFSHFFPPILLEFHQGEQVILGELAAPSDPQSSTPPFQIPLVFYPLQTPPPGAAPTPTPWTSTIMCRREFQIPVHSCHVCLIGFVLAYAGLGAANYNEQNIPTSISNYNLDT